MSDAMSQVGEHKMHGYTMPGRAETHSMAATVPLEQLCLHAAALRDAGHGSIVTYSRKVFIPLTRLCRDVCHYCTFATEPKHLASAYMSADADFV